LELLVIAVFYFIQSHIERNIPLPECFAIAWIIFRNIGTHLTEIPNTSIHPEVELKQGLWYKRATHLLFALLLIPQT